jgi:hypothetical protein
MSTRDRYPAGVPCFVDTLSSDVDAAKRFYAGVFGWEFAGPGAMPDDPPGEYYVARVGGADVAAVGTLPEAAPATAWNTYVSVESADDAAADAQAGGGTVVTGPFDVPPAGRMAVLADPSGAVFCVWEAGQRHGAARVNEPSAWAMSLLSTDDPESAKAFYGRLFGWQAEPFEAGPGVQLWLWRLPGYLGGEPQQPVPRDVVAAMTVAPGTTASWSVDFWIDDADAAAAAAAELGGSVIAAPFEAGGFRRTVLADPGGAAFSASQLLLPA